MHRPRRRSAPAVTPTLEPEPPPALVEALPAFSVSPIPSAVDAVCDVCEHVIEPDSEYALSGEGAYIWTRGDEVRHERVALCAACGTGILGAALARWDMEEDEG